MLALGSVVFAIILVVLVRFVCWDKPEVQAAFVSASVLLLSILVSLLISYFTLVHTPRRLKALEFKLNYVERQMSELYGPLRGLLVSTQRAYFAALRAVELSDQEVHAIEQGEAYLDSYQFFHPKWKDSDRGQAFVEICEKFFIPANQALKRLITEHYHLIGPEPRYRPRVFKEFLDHEAEFRIRFERWKTKFEDDSTEGIEWPATFEQAVEEKIELLTLLQSMYRQQMQGINPPAEVAARISILLQDAERRHNDPHDGEVGPPPRRIVLPDPPPPPPKHKSGWRSLF